jgi:hypothetical protein
MVYVSANVVRPSWEGPLPSEGHQTNSRSNSELLSSQGPLELPESRFVHSWSHAAWSLPGALAPPLLCLLYVTQISW